MYVCLPAYHICTCLPVWLYVWLSVWLALWLSGCLSGCLSVLWTLDCPDVHAKLVVDRTVFYYLKFEYFVYAKGNERLSRSQSTEQERRGSSLEAQRSCSRVLVSSCARVLVYSCPRVLVYSCTCVLAYLCTRGYSCTAVPQGTLVPQSAHV